MIMDYFFNFYIARFIKWLILFRVFRSFVKDTPPIKEGLMIDVKRALFCSFAMEILLLLKESMWN